MEAPYDYETLKNIILKMNPEQSKPVNKGEVLQKWSQQAGASDKEKRNKAFTQLSNEGKILSDNMKIQLGDSPVMMLTFNDMAAQQENERRILAHKRSTIEANLRHEAAQAKSKKKVKPEVVPEPELIPVNPNAKDYFDWVSGQELFVKRLVARETGFMKHPSGFYFRFLKKGGDAGKKSPVADTTSECHYEGCLVTGQIFDSSYKRGEPTKFAPNQVIKCWTTIMQLMREGDQVELVSPPSLAYGDGGAGGAIPPKSFLVFKVEILKVCGDGKSASDAAAALEKVTKKKYEDIPVVKVKEEEKSAEAKKE